MAVISTGKRLHMVVAEWERDDFSSLDGLSTQAVGNINEQNKYGETDLHVAARIDRLDIVKALVDAGADVNVSDTQGYTPLHFAAGKGHLIIVRYLIFRDGIKINAKDRWSRTVLDVAKDVHVKRILSQKGVTQKLVNPRKTLLPIFPETRVSLDRPVKAKTINLEELKNITKSQETGSAKSVLLTITAGFAFLFLLVAITCFLKGVNPLS